MKGQVQVNGPNHVRIMTYHAWNSSGLLELAKDRLNLVNNLINGMILVNLMILWIEAISNANQNVNLIKKQVRNTMTDNKPN